MLMFSPSVSLLRIITAFQQRSSIETCAAVQWVLQVGEQVEIGVVCNR
jgi:hypothetical protein